MKCPGEEVVSDNDLTTVNFDEPPISFEPSSVNVKSYSENIQANNAEFQEDSTDGIFTKPTTDDTSFTTEDSTTTEELTTTEKDSKRNYLFY